MDRAAMHSPRQSSISLPAGSPLPCGPASTNARSMRPFACGLLAQMMSMFSADSARPNWVIRRRRQRPCCSPGRCVPVAVQGHRFAPGSPDSCASSGSNERRLRRDEPQQYQPADRSSTVCSSLHGGRVFEPGVLRAIDRHQFAQAIAPPARLMSARADDADGPPQAIRDIQPRKVSRDTEKL